MSKKEYIPVINNLRGVAALSVCLFHFIYSTVNYIQDQTILQIISYGQYGVSLFFVISGIVIPLSLIRSNFIFSFWPKFFAKRIIRIEPPYLVALALTLIVIVIRNKFGHSTKVELTVAQVGLHLGYLIPFFKEYKWLNEVFWTLAIEFQYYMIISVLILLVIKWGLIARLIFYSIMLWFTLYFTDTNFFPPYSALFLTGTSWVFYHQKKASLFEFAIILLLACSVVWLKLDYVMAIVAFITVLIVQTCQLYSNKILNFLGNISYSLYLIHPIIGASVINLLSHYFIQAWQKPIVIAFGIIITVLTSYIMFCFVEKPTQVLSRRISYK